MYAPDMHLPEFWVHRLEHKNDYEGKVISTLVRKLAGTTTNKAILYIHGFNDYFFNAELAGKFNRQGFHFYALDLRKSGRSWLPHQKLNNVRHLSEYFDDIQAALTQLQSEGIKSILLYGHSMGGLVCSLFAAAHPENKLIKGLFLNSPFFEMNEDWFTRKILVPIVAMKGKWFPNVPVPGRFSKFYGPSLHTDGHGEWDYKLDWKPHLMPFANMGWIRAIYYAQRKLWKGIKITVPIMVMHPKKSVRGRKWHDGFMTGDAILNVESIKSRSASIHGDCTLLAVKDAVHDIMLSKKSVRENAFAALLQWVRQKTDLLA